MNAIYEDMVAFDWTVVGEAVAYDPGLRIWYTLKRRAWIPSSSPKEPGALEPHLINSLSHRNWCLPSFFEIIYL